jgi:uncharacterized pyridoxal phosphate-containing UPF0001 family protein
VQQLPAFDRLRVRGLMTLAIFTPEVERVRACFVRLRTATSCSACARRHRPVAAVDGHVR